MTASRILMILAASATLGACATAPDKEYPSLGIREAEYTSGQVPLPTGDCADTAVAAAAREKGQLAAAQADAPPPPPPALSSDLLQRVAQLEEQARAAHADFQNAVPATRAAVRARGAQGSKSWGRAEVAYANLRSIRARTAISFGELEMLLATRAVEGDPIDEIVLARDVVIGLIAQEDAVLAELAPS
tara:strand:+ start:147 stop:713 length:567 start_codon:yes stop_codon:yes gene_type:complete